MTTLGSAKNHRSPTGLKVAGTSYDKLEVVAGHFRPLLPKKTGSSGGPWKIDAWRLLEKTLHSAKFHLMVAETESLIEAAAFTVPDEGLIVVRQDVYDGLFDENAFSRFTIVHEFSHIALRHAVTLHRGVVTGMHAFYEDSEWQANSLTAALMMPIKACEIAHSCDELATLCGTSVQAATYRLENLIKRGKLDPHRHDGSLFSQLDKTGGKK